MAVVMMGQNAGVLIGPLMFGVLVGASGGWALAFASLPVICLLGVLAGVAGKGQIVRTRLPAASGLKVCRETSLGFS